MARGGGRRRGASAHPRTKSRLEARILERAAHCVQFELNDPRSAFITLTKVELSNDLSIATISWSCLGTEAERTLAGRMLDHAAGFVQRQVGSVLRLRRTPVVRWKYDDSAEHAAQMADLIREARERDRAINPEADAEDELEGTSEPDPDDGSVFRPPTEP